MKKVRYLSELSNNEEWMCDMCGEVQNTPTSEQFHVFGKDMCSTKCCGAYRNKYHPPKPRGESRPFTNFGGGIC